MVKPEGEKKCKIAIVGEAPGQTEEQLGRPFTGVSGSFLMQVLNSFGITRQQCYITNVIKDRPDENDFTIYWMGNKPTQALIKARDELHDELKDLSCTTILALGANALWALTGHRFIKKWRGSVLPFQGKKVIATYHPSAVLRELELSPIFKHDIQKAIRNSHFSEIHTTERNLIIAPSFQEVQDYLGSIKNAFAFDIEVSNNQIICISISDSINKSMSIPTTKTYWDIRLHDVFLLINNLMQTNCVKIAHNALFDFQYIMRAWRIIPKTPWADTMIMHHCCYPDLPKGLDFLTSIYTNEPYYKDDLKVWNTDKSSDEMLWNYNAKDSVITFECYKVLLGEMKELGVSHTYNFMISLLEPLIFMMLHGISIDDFKLQSYITSITEKTKTIESALQDKMGGINLNSPKQLSEYAHNIAKLKPIIKSNKITMNEEALEKYARTNPEFGAVISLRKQKKLVSTYLSAPLDIDGKWRCSYNLTGTPTGRLSSSASIFGSGTNLQNIPKHIRDIVIPEDGMMFTEVDLKGAEALVVAYESRDLYLINLLKEGKNIHNHTAKLIWNVTDDEIERDRESQLDETKSMYYKAKRIRHSGNYLASFVSLQEQLGITAKEAKFLLEKFYDASPNLKNWHSEIQIVLGRTKTIITPFKRKRVFTGRIDKETLRKAIAMIPQDTVSHITNTALREFYFYYYNDPSIKLLLQVHDSILIQHPEDRKNEVHKTIEKIFKIPVPSKIEDYIIPIEIKSGYNWRDLK